MMRISEFSFDAKNKNLNIKKSILINRMHY